MKLIIEIPWQIKECLNNENEWSALLLAELRDIVNNGTPIEQELKTDYKAFAEWVADEIFNENWEDNKGAFPELACRRLEKLGVVKADGDKWKLKEG